MGLEPAARPSVRPERLAVGPGGSPPFARQSLSGVAPGRDAGGIFAPAVDRGPAPENPPVHSPPNAPGRVRSAFPRECSHMLFEFEFERNSPRSSRTEDFFLAVPGKDECVARSPVLQVVAIMDPESLPSFE